MKPDSQVVNPSVLNPDPLAILKESNKIYDPTKQPRIKDGFTIIDGNRAPATRGWNTDAEYNDTTKRNFDYTADNINDAKIRAAREGKPLVVVVGRNTGDTKQLVENIIPNAKNGPRSAIYVYADSSKLDPNSELGKEVSASLGDPNRPFTAIFAPKAGPDGTPALDHHIANTWGARADVGKIIQEQVGSAQTIMDLRKGTFRLPQDTAPGQRPQDATVRPGGETKPEVTDQRKAEDDAEARIAPLAKTVVDSFKQLKGSDYNTRESLYNQAETAASQIKPQDLALVKQKTARDLQAELAKGDGADKAKLDNLKSRQMVLDLMAGAPSWTRMNHGLSLMHFSQLDQGVAKIKEGAQSNPSYLNNPKFIEQLLKTPYELKTLKEKMPEVKFDDYLKHKQAGTLDQFIAANKPKDQPQQVTPPEVKPETRLEPPKQPDKLKYDDGADYQKALEDAFNSGRRLVVKVGTPGCTGCEDMEARAWPDARVQQNLKDKAVFINVDGAQHDELIKKLDALSWPSIAVVEPYRDTDGKIKGRTVEKIEPNTADGRSADSLNGFLDRNLITPKPIQVEVKPVTPQVVTPQVLPSQAELNPNPQVIPQTEVRPQEVRPQEVRPQTDANAQAEADKAVFQRLAAAQKSLLEPLRALPENADAAAIDAAFEKAINNAKQVNPQDVARATEVLTARRQMIQGTISGGTPDQATSDSLKKIDADLAMVRKIDQTEAYLNISRGAVKLKMNPGNPEAGKADIRKGLDMRKELAQDPSVLAKLSSTGYDAAQLKQWFPELPLGGDRPLQPGGPQKDPAKVFDRLREQHAANLQPFAEIGEQPTEQALQDAYRKAIESASKVDPADVQLALSVLETRRQAIMANANNGPLPAGDQQELARLDQDAANYTRIGQADGILYVGLGARKIAANPGNPTTGADDVRKGLSLHPELQNDPAIIDKLRKTGLRDDQLQQWFPGLKLNTAPPQRQEVPPPRR